MILKTHKSENLLYCPRNTVNCPLHAHNQCILKNSQFEHKWVRVSEQIFFWFVPDFLHQLFWRSCRAGCCLTQKITNLKMFCILHNPCKIAINEHIIDTIWWFRLLTTNLWETRRNGPKWAHNMHFGRFWHCTINEWEYHCRIFCLVSDFLQNFFWRSCRAGGGLTRKLQISKCALFFVNLYKVA